MVLLPEECCQRRGKPDAERCTKNNSDPVQLVLFMCLSDDEHKVFSVFLSRRQTAVDMLDSYTGMQDFIKAFETGLVEYEQIFGACASFSEYPN